MKSDPEDSPIYRAGHAARLAGECRLSCPYSRSSMLLHCLWCAGWHDADMELSAWA